MTEADARTRMVAGQVAARGIRDERVLDAMRAVPRELFVPDAMRHHAHADGALPVGDGQTISQPYMVALMAEAAALGPNDRVLEVGGGTGYAAAVLARLALEVVAVERIPKLARDARRRLDALGVANVRLLDGDGTAGAPDHAPYDAIIVSAAARAVPPALPTQLVEGGRLVIPLGNAEVQGLCRFVRVGDALERSDLGPVRFVPLVGG